MSCGHTLAKGQWWNFCGETDMGQTLPALCTECGGEFKRASVEEMAERKRQADEWLAKNPPREGPQMYIGAGAQHTIQSTLGDGSGGMVWMKKRDEPSVNPGCQPQWLMVKQSNGEWAQINNPDYVTPLRDEPSEPDEEDDWKHAGAWVFPAPYGAMHLQWESKPAWWRRKLVEWLMGCRWEDAK